MDASSTLAPASSYTVLRIKRKRTDEPLDALVVSDSPSVKRKRSHAGVFTFAATVEEGEAWDAEALRDKLVVAMGAKTPADGEVKGGSDDKVPTRPNSPAAGVPRKFTIVKNTSSASGTPVAKKVTRDLTVYDAVPAVDFDDIQPGELDSRYLSMLKSFTKAQQLSEPVAAAPGTYVWDVFYHQPLTASAAIAWQAMANTGSVSGLPDEIDGAWDTDDEDMFGGSDDEDSNEENFYRNDYPDEHDSDSGSDEYRQDLDGMDEEGEYIEDPHYSTYDHEDDGAPRLRVRN